MPPLANRNNNPGNLRDTATGSFRQFSSPQEGYAALLNDLRAKQTGTTTTGLGPDSTLADFAKAYAPPSENNSAQYAANLSNHMGVLPNARLRELDLGKWADAIANAEGYKTNSYNPRPFSNAAPGQFNFSGVETPQVEAPDVSTLGGKLKKRGQDIAGAFNLAGQGAVEATTGKPLTGAGYVGSGLLQVAGGGAGALADTIGAGLELIPGVKQLESEVGKTIQPLVQSDIGQKAIEGAQSFSEKHPIAAKDIGALIDIGTIGLGGFGAKAAKTGLERGVYEAAKEGLIGTAAKQAVERSAIKDASEILGSTPLKTEIRSAVRTGGTSVKGGVPGILPDKLKQESIDEVASLIKEGKVSTKKLAAENAAVIKEAADTEAESMRSLIRQREIQQIVQPEDILSMEERVIQRAGTSATPGENPAKTLMQVFKENLPKDRAITAEDVLNARQAVSRFVLENRGDWNMRGVLTGFKSARNAFWDESRDMLATMAPDLPIKESLAKQSALYRALDYIVPNVKSELGTTPFQRFTKQHPVITGLVKRGLEYTGLGAALRLFGE